MLPNVPGERDTIILALHVSIITSNDGKLTGELMDNVANGVCLCICLRVGGVSLVGVRIQQSHLGATSKLSDYLILAKG